MKKNKGYQKDWHKRSWRRKIQSNSFASGTNKTFEQYLADIDHNFDLRVKAAKGEYAALASKTTLEGEDLRAYCRDNMFWEVKFDNDLNLIPLECVLNELEEARKRYKESHSYDYVKRTVNKDNQKFVYNSGTGDDGSRSHIRIPSMKRSNATWKRFYELFPYYKEYFNELNNKNGKKLKKVW